MVVDSDWIIARVLRIISGAVFHILGICEGGAPSGLLHIGHKHVTYNLKLQLAYIVIKLA